MAEKSKKKPLGTRWREYWKKESRGLRFLIGLLILLALATFIHFREVRIESLEIDRLAKNYIVAQVDFEFPDEEGTVILRQESARDIGSIYKLHEKEVKKRRFEFENYIIHHPEWRSSLPSTTFEEMYSTADAVQAELLQARFADPRTIQKIESLKLTSTPFFVYPHDEIKNDETMLPQSVWKSLETRIKRSTGMDQATLSYIVWFFNQTPWRFDKDPSTQRTLRKEAESLLPEKFTSVQAGSRIIDKGEKVSSRHLSMLHAMKQALAEKRKLWQPLTIIGSLLLASVITVLGAGYFRIKYRKIYTSVSQLALFATILIFSLGIGKLVEYLMVYDSGTLTDIVRYPLIVPLAAILMTVLLNFEIAFFVTTFLTIVMGLTLAVDHSRFIFVNLIAGVIAILCARSISKRKEVFVVCGKVWLSVIPIFFIFIFAQNTWWSYSLVSDLMSTFAFMLATAILIIGLLPLLESIFSLMTNMTLMEYMDPNNELLRRLSIEAPGTYQHCLVVGSLAEEAAREIGANGLLCRVATLYHDIGKLFNPHYFTENVMGGFNIHQLLTPIESAQVILAHVTDGEQLARKYNLPKSFIDVIREHHGTTLVYYFYSKQLELEGGNKDAVDENLFRYPGPTPRTKESAIIMIADTIEAASRSLKEQEVSREVVTEMVNRLVQEKAQQGQFDHCQLTFEELDKVKKKIIDTLMVTRHVRIQYPKRAKEEPT